MIKSLKGWFFQESFSDGQPFTLCKFLQSSKDVKSYHNPTLEKRYKIQNYKRRQKTEEVSKSIESSIWKERKQHKQPRRRRTKNEPIQKTIKMAPPLSNFLETFLYATISDSVLRRFGWPSSLSTTTSSSSVSYSKTRYIYIHIQLLPHNTHFDSFACTLTCYCGEKLLCYFVWMMVFLPRRSRIQERWRGKGRKGPHRTELRCVRMD